MKIIIDMWNWLISNSNALMVILTGFTLIASIIIQIRLENKGMRTLERGYMYHL